MLETLLGMTVSSAIGIIGTLAAIVSLITEVLKNILPDSFPTKALVIIISLITTIAFSLVFYAINIQSILFGIVGGFVVAYISMYGFDTLKELFLKFKISKGDEINGK